MTIQLIVAGVIGSAFTVLIEKLFDIWNKKIDYKNTIKINILERKINAAEKAAMTWYAMAETIQVLAFIFESLCDEDVPTNMNLFYESIQKNFHRLSELEEDLKVNIIFLYIGAENNYEKNQQIFKLLTQVGYLLRVFISTKDNNHVGEEFFDNLPNEIKEKSIELSNILNDFHKDIIKKLSDLRKELDKYI